MKNIISALFLFISLSGLSQSSQQEELRKSKGTWIYPLKHLTEIDWFTDKPTRGAHQTAETYFTSSISGDSVFSVYKGKVQGTFMVGEQYAVMITYGGYYFTYVLLQKPCVNKNDFIGQGQFLGKLDSGTSTLSFLLSDSADKFYPPHLWFKPK